MAKSERTEGAQKCSGLYSGKNYLIFQLNNALIYMFPTFRTKHEKRVHLGQDKGKAPFLLKIGRQAEFSS